MSLSSPIPLRRVFFAYVLSLAVGVALHAAEPTGKKRALLVGCTAYPNLAASLQLEGPGNDAYLLRDLLVSRLAFSPDRIVVLADQEKAPERLPTRANIERGFRRLAEEAASGDEIVILLAGHGSRAPDLNPTADDPEPDGFDEIFLARDVAPWNGELGSIPNSIRDDEIRQWLAPILRRGARVCLVIDACHSGSMVRGADIERTREVPAAVLVPPDVLKAAQARAATASPADGVAGEFAGLADVPGWVAIYAAQSTEPTVERLLPPRGDDAKMHGLLTFTIGQILTSARTPLSYAELGRRLRALYSAWGRTFPTPLIEGPETDREVFGSERLAQPPVMTLTKSGGKGPAVLRVDRGALGGVRTGAILAVWPPPGETRGAQPLGYVRVQRAAMAHSEVASVAFGGVAAVESLPAGAVCEVAQWPEPEWQLRVAAIGDAGNDPTIAAALEKCVSAHRETIARVPPAEADWVIRRSADGATVLPAEGVATESPGSAGQVFGPHALDEKFAPWLASTLQRIFRARMLLRVTEGPGEAAPPQVELSMLRFDADGKAVPFASAASLELRAGDRIGFEVRNQSDQPLDVTLLLIDSELAVSALLPQRGMVEDNRLPAGKSLRTRRFTVTDNTAGLEHAVVLAVPGQGAPVDFSYLEEPGPAPERTRGAQSGGSLGRLVRMIADESGKTRGLAPSEASEFAAQVLSWRVRR